MKKAEEFTMIWDLALTVNNYELFWDYNIPNELGSIRTKLCEIIKRTAHFRQNPAMHMYVMMVCSETCDKKLMLCHSNAYLIAELKEIELCGLISDTYKEMTFVRVEFVR